MNNRLILNLLHRRRRPHQGFAFAMSMMIGMVILVVAAAMLIRGQEDQNKVVSQTAKNIANAAAEAGLTRVVNFVKNNPATAAYQMEDWSNATMMTAAVTQTTTPTSSSGVDTVNTTNFCPGASPTPPPSGSSANNTTSAIATEVSQITGSSGQILNTGDTEATRPHFRLEQYVYDSTTGTAQVRVAGFAGNPSNPKAKTNLVATIPVAKTQETVTVTSGVLLPASFPSLWIKVPSKVDSQDKGLASVYSDVLGPCTPPSSDWDATPKQGIYKTTPQQMPDAPSVPNDSTVGDLGSNIADGTSLPLSSDIPKTNPDGTSNPDGTADAYPAHYDSTTKRYTYKVGKIDFNGNGTKLTFKPGYKVTLYVTGNITPGTADVKHDCGTVAGCNVTNAMIIGSPSNTSGEINMNGNTAFCNIFVWAPTYNLQMSGGGGGSPRCAVPLGAKAGSNNTGVYWVKTFNSTANESSNQVTFSDQDPNLWPTITNVVNNLATNDIPATSSTTATYTKVGLGQPTAWGMKDSDYVVTVPSGTVVGY